MGTARLVGDPATGRGPVGQRPGAVYLGGNKDTWASPTMRTLPPISWHPPREPTHKDALKPLWGGLLVLCYKLGHQRPKTSILCPLVPCNSSIMVSRELQMLQEKGRSSSGSGGDRAAECTVPDKQTTSGLLNVRGRPGVIGKLLDMEYTQHPVNE